LVLVVAVVLLAVSLLTVVAVRRPDHTGALDPANPGPGGARALAEVLADRGVDVQVVRRAADLERATTDADTTVMVTATQNLGRTTARQLDRRSARAGTLVLAAPEATATRVLGLPLEARLVDVGGATDPAGCHDPLLRGLRLDVGTAVAYRVRRGSSVRPCFQDGGRQPWALVVRVERRVPTYVIGGTDLLTNGRITHEANAAAALRLLGQHPRLVWYVPDPADVPLGDTGSFRAQLPRGLGAALLLAGIAVLATMLWRGRRLGPLVTEPLPVVVRAVESTQGRGRLYRRVRDRPHVAELLREATARRLAEHLRLPRDLPREGLVPVVADVARRDAHAVQDLLLTRPVPDDRALTRLAADLAALEREVHRP
jgi:hypothetical protein